MGTRDVGGWKGKGVRPIRFLKLFYLLKYFIFPFCRREDEEGIFFKVFWGLGMRMRCSLNVLNIFNISIIIL